jgi:hypothetical protein
MAPKVVASVQTTDVSAARAKVANKPRQTGARCMMLKRCGTKRQICRIGKTSERLWRMMKTIVCSGKPRVMIDQPGSWSTKLSIYGLHCLPSLHCTVALRFSLHTRKPYNEASSTNLPSPCSCLPFCKSTGQSDGELIQHLVSVIARPHARYT